MENVGISRGTVLYTLKTTNWVLLCVQCVFMLVIIYMSAKYIRQFSSFKDFYTLMTLITLIISLLWDCVALPDAYPWKDIDIDDMLTFVSMQLSKGFFLMSVVMYATRWVQIMMKNNSSTPQQLNKLRIGVASYIVFSLSLEIYIITERGIDGAYEDDWMGFDNEFYPIALLEILAYLVGSAGCIYAYWYSYRYFHRVISILHTA